MQKSKATTKKTARPARKTAAKKTKATAGSTRFFTFRSFEEPLKKVGDMVDDGKEFAQDFQKDTRRKVTIFVKKVRKNPRKTLQAVMDDSREKVEELRSDARDKVGELRSDARDKVGELRSDARGKVEDLVDDCKAMLKRTGRSKTAITIKKYANGRYYDTAKRSYLTKDKMAALLRKKANVTVIFTKTGQDITQDVREELAAPAKEQSKTPFNIDTIKKINTETAKKWITEQVDQQVGKLLEKRNLVSAEQVSELLDGMQRLSDQMEALQKKQDRKMDAMQKRHIASLEAIQNSTAAQAAPGAK